MHNGAKPPLCGFTPVAADSEVRVEIRLARYHRAGRDAAVSVRQWLESCGALSVEFRIGTGAPCVGGRSGNRAGAAGRRGAGGQLRPTLAATVEARAKTGRRRLWL